MGIFSADFYSREGLNWQLQSVGQDMVDLYVVVPVLLVSAILAYRNNSNAMPVWSGTILYLIYTFVIYCFDVHFNKLFIVYCFTLGLSFYSLLYFLYTQVKSPIINWIENKRVILITGIYFLILPVIFYVLWLSEIIPAIVTNTTPKSISEAGLFTNPVHIIDLAVFLPGLFITGILLLKRNTLSLLLVPMLLSFFVLMDITIGWLVVMMQQKGLATNLSVTVVMTILAVLSLLLLIWYMKNARKNIASLKLELNVNMK